MGSERPSRRTSSKSGPTAAAAATPAPAAGACCSGPAHTRRNCGAANRDDKQPHGTHCRDPRAGSDEAAGAGAHHTINSQYVQKGISEWIPAGSATAGRPPDRSR